MDDISAYGKNFKEALHNLEKVIIRCKETHIAFSNIKFQMMIQEGSVLGNYVSFASIKVDPAKIKSIMDPLVPCSQKEVRSFQGHEENYKRFVDFFAKIDAPMFKLLSKYVYFLCESQCQKYLETLKVKVSTKLLLMGPNWSLPFHIFTNDLYSTLGLF